MADILLSRYTPSGDRLEVGAPAVLEPAAIQPASVPKPIGPLYGYAEEGTALQAAVERGTPSAIGICGPSGVGKSEFLVRALLLGREAWPDGHVFLPVRNLGARDIIALLTDVVFAISDPRLRPPMAVCIAALAERRLLVGLDDLRSAQELAVLRSALRGSMLCFTSSEHWVTGDVAWIPLRGLKTAEGVALVRATASKKISDDLATKIVSRLEGNPSRILRAIGGDSDLEDIATPEAFERLQVSRAERELSVNDAVGLSALATFWRAALGAKSPRATLVKRCLVERSSIGWSVPEGLRRHIEGLSIEPAAVAAAVLEALPEDGLSDPYAAVDCAAGLSAVMSRGGTAAQQLAGVVCLALDRYGLWDVSTGLYQGLYAMRESLEDRKMRRWVVHQLATRLACAGEIDAARDLFNQALAAEEDDEEATAITAGNLAQLSARAAVEPPAAAISSGVEPRASGTDEPGSVSLVSTIVPPLEPQAGRSEVSGGALKARRRVAVGGILVLAGAAALGVSIFVHAPAASEPPPAAAIRGPSATTKPSSTAPNARPMSLRPIGATRHAVPRSRSTPKRIAAYSAPPYAQPTPHVAPRKTALALGASPPQPSFEATAAPRYETSAAAARTGSVARVAAAGVPAAPSPVHARSLATRAPSLVVLAPIAGPSAGPVAQRPRSAGSPHSASPPAPETPRIIPFTILPASVASGSTARLCVSASHAETLYVSGLGNFDPQQTNCRTVKPAKTTTYVARATNRAGQSAVRALTVVVR